MDYHYRIAQPTGLLGYPQRHGQTPGDSAPGGGARSKTGPSGEAHDGRDFASILDRLLAR